MTITPKADFVEAAKANGWRWSDVVTSEQFQEAAKTAMLHMLLEEPNATIADHAEHSQRLCGAQRFLAILMSLTETTTAPEPAKPRTLTYT